MEKKLISVIIPVYNSEKYLEKCVESILAQTFKNVEIILVDDGSRDGSPELCDRLAAEHKNIVAVHKKNGGVGSARNTGIDNAHGDYITFIDNDDYIDNDTYEILLREALESGADITQINVKLVDEGGNVIGKWSGQQSYTQKISAREYRKSIMLQEGNVCCWSKLFKRTVLEKHRFIDGRWNEDFILMYNIMLDIPYIFSVDEYKYNYVQRKGSYSKAGFNQGIIDNVVNAKWVLGYSEEHEPEMVEYAVRLYFHQMIPYMLFMPVEDMNANNAVYKEFSDDLKKYKSIWSKNRFLNKKEKLLLKGLCLSAVKLRAILKAVNYKGWYR